MMTEAEEAIRSLSDNDLARYLKDYGRLRAGEISILTIAAADRILALSDKVWKLEARNDKG